ISMPTFRDFYFESSTGKNMIHARICTPDGAPKAIVQITHGIAEYIERYDDFIFNKYPGKVMVVETDDMDFLNNPKDFASITDRIDSLFFGLFPERIPFDENENLTTAKP
ncbi:MAG: hypothetical protein Q4A15_10055, partial [Prevotellaceae bacterium]|nr:hypothetical protein [Prevotellaceae bacterium]